MPEDSAAEHIKDLGGVLRKAKEAGVQINPSAQMTRMQHTPGSGTPIVIVERVQGTPQPDYCVHGYVECVHCGELCYLGDQTHQSVLAGRVVPPVRRVRDAPAAERRWPDWAHRRREASMKRQRKVVICPECVAAGRL